MDIRLSHEDQQHASIPRRARQLSYYQEYVRYQLERFVEPWAVKYVAPAMAGDIEAARSLSLAAGNEKRGVIVVEFWRARAPVPAFRELLQGVWEHDHQEIIWAAKTRRTVQAIFRYARFSIPDLPPTVQVWRGTDRLSPKLAAKGYSWSLDRDVACWFAVRFARKEDSNPLVLMAEVPREAIAFYSDARSEREVVLLHPPVAVIDGNPEDWRKRFSVKAAELEAKTRAWMAKVAPRPSLSIEPHEYDPEAERISAWLGLT